MVAHHPKSKKPFGANFSSKPLKPTVFFLDRSLGKNKIANALRQAGAEVQIHDDHFESDAKDEYWISQVSKKGWIILTKDERIRYRNLERNALIEGKVGAFILTSGNLSGDEMAQIFIKALPNISRFLAKYPLPFIASITRSGKVSILSSKP